MLVLVHVTLKGSNVNPRLKYLSNWVDVKQLLRIPIFYMQHIRTSHFRGTIDCVFSNLALAIHHSLSLSSISLCTNYITIIIDDYRRALLLVMANVQVSTGNIDQDRV